MIVLADTSVWVGHFRAKNQGLSTLLEEGVVAVHPFVLTELALGNLRKGCSILSLLEALPEAPTLNQPELSRFIEERRLAGSGIGFVDAHLLASTRLMRGVLWTIDKKLRAAADALDLSYL
jgi:predicted nucleic acid-binding protein